MGVTGVIDRTTTIKDRSVERGMECEIIASEQQCGSKSLFYVVGVLDPGQHTGIHVHDDVEIAWFMLEGSTFCVMGSFDEDDFVIEECEANSAGYVAPGELHLHVNRSESDKAVILMAYVGTNTVEGARGRELEVPAALQGVLATKSIELSYPATR
jgi:uncharacterized RmlC-like cupin family protein